MQQHDTNERLTNLFYKMYNIPMFTLGLSCCRMPPQQDIASIWRKNVDKFKNFLHLIDTGITGHVENGKGQPLRDAFIRLTDHNSIYNVTKNAARFQIILPEGEYGLEIKCTGYEIKVQRVIVKNNEITNLGNVQLNEYTLVTGVSEIKQLAGGGGSSTISGIVLDTSNHPIPNAKVSIVSPKSKFYLRNFTDSLGAYSISRVQPGDITLKVEAPRHVETTRLLHVGTMGANIPGVVFRLKSDEKVLGMSKLMFIIKASILLVLLIIGCVVGVQCMLKRRVRGDKPYYNFSLLPQKGKELFEDDADGETELFRSPIKSK